MAIADEDSAPRQPMRSLLESPLRQSKDRTPSGQAPNDRPAGRLEGEQSGSAQLGAWLQGTLQAGISEVVADLHLRYEGRMQHASKVDGLSGWLTSEFEAERAALTQQLEDLAARLMSGVHAKASLQASGHESSHQSSGIDIQREGYRGADIVEDMIKGRAHGSKDNTTGSKGNARRQTQNFSSASPNSRANRRIKTMPAPQLPALPQALFNSERDGQASVEPRGRSKDSSRSILLPNSVPMEGKWQYTPYNGLDSETRFSPAIDAERTGHRLAPGDYFTAVEEKVSEEQGKTITFLRLDNNLGWLFDRNADGVMSTRCVAEARAPAREESRSRSKAAPTEDEEHLHFVEDAPGLPGCIEDAYEEDMSPKSRASENHPSRTSQESAAKIRRTGSRKSSKNDLPFADDSSTARISNRIKMLRGIAPDDEFDDEEPFGYCWLLEDIVGHPAFDIFFAILIIVNSFVMALQVQYRGIQDGFDLGYPSSTNSAEAAWPQAKESFEVMEWLFAFAFSLELFCKLCAKRSEFPKDHWNVLDFIIVLFWYVDTLGNATLPFPPMLLRLARLVRLLRLLRLVRKIQSFDSLYLMTTAIKGSFSALAWSTVLLFVVQMMIALFMNEMLEPFMLDEGSPKESRLEVYTYYGTFSRSMVTMFELTLANWITPARVLSENVSEWYTIFSLTHQLVIGFAVVKVIMGVFMHETFKVAATDDAIMVSEKERAIKLHTAKMKLLFEAADEDGNGLLDREEFNKLLEDPAIRTWLSAMELDVSDAEVFYDLICDGKEELTAEELVRGVAKLKGGARSIDMIVCMRETEKLRELTEELVYLMKKQKVDRPGAAMGMKSLAIASAKKKGRISPDKLLALTKMAEEQAAAFAAEEEERKSSKNSKESLLSMQPAHKPYKPSMGARIPGRTNTKPAEPMFGSLRNFVTSPTFDIVFAALIMGNSLIMAAEAQYHGLDTGFEIGAPSVTRPAAESLPGALTFFNGCEMLFGIMFTVELALKIVALKKEFFLEWWNYFDGLIVISWLVSTLAAANLPLDPMILRLARLVRLLRLLRLVRTMKGFGSLYLLVTSIKGSFSALAWSSVLLFVIQMMVALFLNEMLEPFVLDPNGSVEMRHEVYRYFGTFSKAMLTMFEITLANWIPVCRLLGENVNEFYVIFSIAHKCVIGFAVVLVMTGVFMQQTFKVAATDDTIMQMSIARSIKIHTDKMRLLFEAADEDGNGTLDKDEFKKILDDKSVRTWLAAMEMQVDDADRVFALVAPQSEDPKEEPALTAEHLVRGVAKLKGKARSLDLHVLMREHKLMSDDIHQLAVKAGVSRHFSS